MRTKGCFNWTYIAIAAIAISVAACGNSQKKKEKEKEREQAKQTAIQPQDSVTIIESETVIVAVDSIAPDSVATKKATVNTPKKTK